MASVAEALVPLPPRRRRPRGRQRGDAGTRPAFRGQVALGGQLGVTIHHHAARYAQLIGQIPAWRQCRPVCQPPGTDRRTQRAFKLSAERDTSLELDLQIHDEKLPGSA